MFPLSIRMNIQTLLFSFVLSLAYGQDRNITSYINPGCKIQTEQYTLIYIKAKGSDDTLHQIWDFTRGIPTTIFAVAGVNSSLDITWEVTRPTEFRFSETPRYSFAAAIDKLYEYDDLDDVGYINDRAPRKAYSFSGLHWQRNNSVRTEKEVMMRMHASRGEWAIEVKLDLIPFKDYAVELPHLIHTANSTLVDFSLVNLTMSREYNASRFALHMVLASSDSSTDSMHCDVRKSLDDEHTPGVFEIVEIKTPGHPAGGFVQFRPVAYTQPARGVASSTIAHTSTFNRTVPPHHSTLQAFYKDTEPEDLLVQDLFISFGETGDGYYKQHNYTAWSFTIGYGAPPIESFSLFVVIIISIGLGVPVLLALSGVVYVVSRRCKQRNAPTRLRDEE